MTARTRTVFDPQSEGVHFFSDAERDEAYLNARPFFLEQMRILIGDHGWKRNNSNSDSEVSFFANHL